jgi:SAM-dependent methyltransferase
MHHAAAANIIDLYERHAVAWVAARKSAPVREAAWLERFEAALPRAAQVLDIGCGAGEPIARFLLERGHGVTGVDSANAMIAMFRRNCPEAEAVVADMRSLSLGRGFDGLIAWDSFFHLPPGDQRRMFGVFGAHALPGAMLMFSSGPAAGEAIGVLEGEELYHASLAGPEYRHLLGHAGFEVLAQINEDPDCGGRTVWLAKRTRTKRPEN